MADKTIAVIKKNSREEIRLALGEFNGRRIFNARVWFDSGEGGMRPGKAGIAFSVDHLPEFARAVMAAAKAAEVT